MLNGRCINEARLLISSVIDIGPYQLKAYDELALAQKDAEQVEESTRKELHPSHPGYEHEQRVKELTPAQFRVYREFLSGHTEKEIAHILRLSVHTVHAHSRAIYAKFGVTSRGELLSFSVGRITRSE